MQLGGIYEIVNTVNQKRYIGSSVNFTERWGKHRRGLTRGEHRNRHLQNAWNKHGASAFDFRPLMICPSAELLAWEQSYITELAPEYNTATNVERPMLGRTHTEEARRKIGAASKGNKHMLGRTHPLQTRAKLAAASRGRKHTQESLQKMSRVQTGRVVSDAARAKLSAARMGRVVPDETRAKISATTKGRSRPPFSDEWRMHLSLAAQQRQGRTQSDEAKAKVAASMRAVWAARKAAKCN